MARQIEIGGLRRPRQRRSKEAARGSIRPADAASRPESRNPAAAARAAIRRFDWISSARFQVLSLFQLQSITANVTLGFTPTSKMPDDSTPGQKFQRLVEIMARLRAPGGCPWDREQTFESIKPYTLEETYEVLDAIDRRDWAELRRRTGRFHAAGGFLRADGGRREAVSISAMRWTPSTRS